jgi:TatD DNase family protein
LSRHPFVVFFFNDTATTEIYTELHTLSLHDALPICRAADAEMIAILQDETAKGPFPGVLHCFSSGPELARAALALGFYISFSGIITFKNADEVRAVALETPLERLLVETDAPYLAPIPHRGKDNEPAFVANTANKLAELRGVTGQEMAEQSTGNFFRLFTKALAAGHGNSIAE